MKYGKFDYKDLIVWLLTGKIHEDEGELPMNWLNSDTKFIISQVFEKETRELALIREAYFDVVENQEHPFIVDVGGLQVKAFCANFNIKAYPEEPSISATLE